MINYLDLNGSNARYEADSLGDITEDILRRGFAQGNCTKLSFNLLGADTDEYGILKQNISEAYAARIQYHATKEHLILPLIPEGPFSVTVVERDVSFIRELYLHKIMELYSEWRQYVTPDRVEFSKNVAQYRLSPENSVCIAKGSVPIGLTTLYKREDGATFCLNWIWFDPKLPPQDRACAHYLTVEWLKRKGYTITAFVDSFNQRSQRFFRKIGFRAICLHITKNSR